MLARSSPDLPCLAWNFSISSTGGGRRCDRCTPGDPCTPPARRSDSPKEGFGPGQRGVPLRNKRPSGWRGDPDPVQSRRVQDPQLPLRVLHADRRWLRRKLVQLSTIQLSPATLSSCWPNRPGSSRVRRARPGAARTASALGRSAQRAGRQCTGTQRRGGPQMCVAIVRAGDHRAAAGVHRHPGRGVSSPTSVMVAPTPDVGGGAVEQPRPAIQHRRSTSNAGPPFVGPERRCPAGDGGPYQFSFLGGTNNGRRRIGRSHRTWRFDYSSPPPARRDHGCGGPSPVGIAVASPTKHRGTLVVAADQPPATAASSPNAGPVGTVITPLQAATGYPRPGRPAGHYGPDV